MTIDIVRGKISNRGATELLVNEIGKLSEKVEGTLFLGYLLRAADKNVVTVDALLVSKQYGLIAFIFAGSTQDVYDEHDKMYYQLDNTLKQYNSLRKGRNLAFEPNVITFFPTNDSEKYETTHNGESYFFVNPNNLENTLAELPHFDERLFEKLQEALHKISSMKPRKDRENVTKENSLGSKIKEIEKEIANLDVWQKKAAFEVPEGPQRVRGLAGSGKTIVLALKAAYLHAQNPDWDIVVTYYTRSLGQQFNDLITKFSFEFLGHEPNPKKLHIIHAWGTGDEIGVYSTIANALNIVPLTFNTAKAKFGRDNAFEGICNELLYNITENYQPVYDAILIDEAQDMPPSFFKLCYEITKDPKRIVFAYDELQNLTNDSMPDVKDLFGVDKHGNPRVSIENERNSAQRDIVLPVCYRNTRWALTMAHTLGFGIYRQGGLVQLFKDLELWNDIGYRKVSGSLAYGEPVVLKRKDESSPAYFDALITPDEALELKKFNSKLEQYKWVSEQIERDIKEEELDYDDILVIFPDAYYSKSDYMEFRKFLNSKGIDSLLAGVTTDRDTFRLDDTVTCSSIFRAKGNEAPKVYILNAEFCATGSEMIKLRNILFTAITRSRGWVKICGVGNEMQILLDEAQKCITNGYTLDFTIPTLPQLEQMRLIHGDKSEEDKKKITIAQSGINELIGLIAEGKIDPNSLPEIQILLNTLQSRSHEE
ncbi:ATP-binding domain-containing protein [Brevibacillus borstelensis]|jgi:superfamily I DNA and RNA helicase|uniref:DEAD/DEAH box helicase n=1 Tax=Brevibacillus borstelensis TaxID=45462 RepID=UPI0014907401|nr:ATP-binding domain-containing protein [Brevibacillus borstelensis]MCM3559766.1 ATP-binding domain-containing protein [Brevibacillus borstelensis]MED1853472.1 ATP-binding domain-containing protein [Brevibacillus borstelensis]NOU56049.1 ATP-binding domain-containing protein [Brevibacillus borstelensis]